jgi:SH3-like domain-containing protein
MKQAKKKTDARILNSKPIFVSLLQVLSVKTDFWTLALPIVVLSLVWAVPGFCQKPPGGLPEKAFVRVAVGNLRSEPSMNAPISGKIYHGAQLKVIEKKGAWFRVQRESGDVGWIHESILVFSSTKRNARENGKVLHEVHFKQEDNGQEKVVFMLSGFYPPETFALEGDRPRIVCDFYGVRMGSGVEGPIRVEKNFIREIRFGVYKEDIPKVRAVLDLVPGKDYAVKQFFFKEDNAYTIILDVKR